MPKMPSNLHRSKEEMPGDIDGGVDERGGENRAGLAPSPAVEKPGDGGQDHIAPVGEAHVGDVREPEENGGGPQPARSLLDARESKFWSRPRKRNSSGQAVKQRMPSETRGKDLSCDHCGSN